jgi:3-dehydroquinate synthase
MSGAFENVRVSLGARSYDVVVGPGALGELAPRLAALVKRPRAFVLTDTTVGGLHLPALERAAALAGISLITRAVAPGEATKSFAQLGEVLDWLLRAGAERSDVLIAFGGGVIGDLGGLAASLMKRGMGFVQVPTTLLAQVDSSVGGKTAINAAAGKNLIGAFYQPRFVIADTALLATLPKRDLAAGYAEIVKYGLINDAAFFDWLATTGGDVLALKPAATAHAVAVSCRAKAAIVAQDETETGVRQLLNLGHTFAHALEAANGFGPELVHGEAVAMGCALAFRFSAELGLAAQVDAARVSALLAAAGLPVRFADLAGGPYEPGALTELMQADKKARAGRVPLILARGIGKAFVHPDADLGRVAQFLETERILTMQG